MALKMLENLFAAWPLLVFFLSLVAAIFACKAHGQAVENGEILRRLRQELESAAAACDHSAPPTLPTGPEYGCDE